jgi:hypothetical protein
MQGEAVDPLDLDVGYLAQGVEAEERYLDPVFFAVTVAVAAGRECGRRGLVSGDALPLALGYYLAEPSQLVV